MTYYKVIHFKYHEYPKTNLGFLLYEVDSIQFPIVSTMLEC